MSSAADRAKEQEIERQLKEWKEQMRAERSQRLAQARTAPANSPSVNIANNISAETSAVATGKRTATAPQPVQHVASALTIYDSAQASARETKPPLAPTTLEDYKREMAELAGPPVRAATNASSSRLRASSRGNTSASVEQQRHNGSGVRLPSSQRRQSVNPRDVTFHAARSVVGEYIRRPLRSAEGRPRSAQGTTGTSSEGNRGRPPARASSSFLHRSATSGEGGVRGRERSSRPTSAHGTARTRSASVLGRSEKRVRDAASVRPLPADSTRWTRSALLRHEAAARTLEQRAKEERPVDRRIHRRQSRDEDGPVAEASRSHVEVSFSGTSTTHGAQPARALFTAESPPRQRRPSPPRGGVPLSDYDGVSFNTQSSWRTAVARSRLQPTIVYGNSSVVNSWPRRNEGSSNTAAALSQPATSWRSRLAEMQGGEHKWAAERLSVSPPTPSPLGTRERRDPAAAEEVNWRQRGSANSWRKEGTTAQAAVPLDDSLEGGKSPTRVWTNAVPGPSVTRSDLFQGGGQRLRGEGGNSGRPEEVPPQPRTLQPHPRPLWYREGR